MRMTRQDHRRCYLVNKSLTMLWSPDEGHSGHCGAEYRAMGRLSLHAPISSSSRRRLARWLVGSPISVVERDLVLETLAHTHGNRTVSARLLGVSVRTLRNKITEYSAEGLDIPRHESRDEISRAETIVRGFVYDEGKQHC
jgi:DNA-binding NtrC family response regulator